MNKRWRNAGLYALLVVVVIALATAIFDNSGQEVQSWRYSKFLDAVQNHQIERVSISADRSRVRFTDPEGNGQIVVNLPNDSDLINTLETNNVDMGVLPQSDDNVWVRALSTLLIPVLLLVVLEVFVLLAKLPFLGAALGASHVLSLLNLSFTVSLHSLVGLVLAVIYAGWVTAMVVQVARGERADLDAALPVAGRHFLRLEIGRAHV